MKKYYVCIQAGNEGVYIKADWFEIDGELIFHRGNSFIRSDSFTVAVFKTWEYFLEVEE